MNDFISRQDVIDAVHYYIESGYKCDIFQELKNLPSAELGLEIIRCADCKWWCRLENGHPYGYCRACQSGTHTERWDIHIQRQSKFDFYCADAEPKEDDDDDD